MIEESKNWPVVQARIKETVRVAHPGVVFADIWVRPRAFWSGGDMVEVWAVYDGQPADLGTPVGPMLEVRLQDLLWIWTWMPPR